jgi:hypothetical protein
MSFAFKNLVIVEAAFRKPVGGSESGGTRAQNRDSAATVEDWHLEGE